MCGEKSLETGPFIALQEPVEGLVGLPDQVVDVKEHLAAHVPEPHRSGRSLRHPVADTGRLDQDLAPVGLLKALEELSPQRPDHRSAATGRRPGSTAR